MAGNVYSWSTTAASNATADSDVNWAEGQLPGTVNGSARAMMAGVASWLKDTNGTITSGGSANAYTIASSTAYAALATGLRIVFKANHTNTGAATLTLNALTSKAIRMVSPAGDIALPASAIVSAGHYEVEYDSAANSAAGAWILKNPAVRIGQHGSDIASASTINLDAATGDLIDVTGTTTITAITLADGQERTVRFTGALTLTHGASLVIPAAANITTAAGDFAVFRGYASSVVRCVSYVRASGFNIAGLQSKRITASRVMDATDGNVAYTGVGFKPRALIVLSGVTGDINPTWGICDADGNAAGISAYNLSSNATKHGSTTFIRGFTGTAGSAYTTGTLVSMDADGFTLSWVKTSPASLTLDMHFLCIR